MKIILHSNNCPKCNILKKKLIQKNISFEENNDLALIVNQGFTLAPVLQIDEAFLNFKEANSWLEGYNGN